MVQIQLFNPPLRVGSKPGIEGGKATVAPLPTFNNRTQFKQCVPIKAREAIIKLTNDYFSSPTYSHVLRASL
jgi:hypothetical protein